MAKAKPKKRVKKPDPPTSMGYDQLAAHLGVSRRQVIRYVVAGQIPRPEIVRKTAVWTGDALVYAMSGPALPLSFEYVLSDREERRMNTLAANAAARKRTRPIRHTRKRSTTEQKGDVS